MQANGVCVLFVGISGAIQEMMTVTSDGLESGGTMMIVASFAIGSLLGEWINLEHRIEQFGNWLKVKTGNSREKMFVDGFVTASLLIFCVGINLLWEKKLKVANMLPAIVIAVICAFLGF